MITLVPGREEQLEETLRTLYKQSPIFEVILICPSNFKYSIEFTENYLRRYPNCKIVTTPDSTPSEGIGNGLAIASGEFVYCLNAGDFILGGAFHDFNKMILKHTDTNVFVGHGILLDETRHLKGIMFSKPIRPADIVNNLTSFVHQSTFIRRKTLLEVGGFNSKIRTAYDLEILVKLYKSGHKIRIVNSYWGAWTLENNSFSYSSTFANERSVDLQAIRSDFGIIRFQKIRGLLSSFLEIINHPLRPLLHRGIFAQRWIRCKKITLPGQ